MDVRIYLSEHIMDDDTFIIPVMPSDFLSSPGKQYNGMKTDVLAGPYASEASPSSDRRLPR
jgi:hypothetical protein